MTRWYAFNGDADGLCALQQLRLAESREGTLVTGVKRDIALLGRVEARAGDECVVLDVSLDVNRAPLVELLARGVSVRYFDHHHSGELPASDRFEAHIDESADVCTSLLVDRYLGGRHRAWAVTGAFGDSLKGPAAEHGRAAGLDDAALRELEELGVCLNYNAYGESVADLHVPPADLAEQMLGHADPLDFARSSETYRTLHAGYESDMERTRRLEPSLRVPGAIVFVLPAERWARRASGVFANEVAREHGSSAVAIVSTKESGDYLVSVRVPASAPVAAEAFCRRFPTGGGRRTAGGINHLPQGDLAPFTKAFEETFAASG